MHTRRTPLAARHSLVLALCFCVSAGPTLALDFGNALEDFDFNDYAVGIATAITQQPYRGVSHTQMLYPFLTSVQDSTLTENVFVVRNGTYGFRHVSPSGLEIGVQGRLEVLGFGPNPDPPLDQLEPPQWTIEAGPSIGWRRGPLQPDLSVRKGIWGGHQSWVGEFSLSAPIELRRGFIVPYASINFKGSDYLDHYFGVRPRGDRPVELPSYATPEDAQNYRLGVRVGYRLSSLWILTGNARVDFLDDDITASPLVGRSTLAAFSLGLAYNRSIFAQQNPDWRGELNQPRFSLSVYGVAGSTSSDLVLSSASSDIQSDGPGKELGDALPLDSDPEFLRADIVWRIRERHRLEASYTDIRRFRTLEDGEDRFRLEQSSRFARIAYGYSLVNTAQKELGVLLGLHWPRLTASIEGENPPEISEVDASAPMFSVGAYGRLAMRHGLAAEARVEAGGLDVGQYDGTIFDARGVLSWKPTDWLALLAGYSWQITRLDGYTDGFRGRFDQQTHGPLIGLRLSY